MARNQKTNGPTGGMGRKVIVILALAVFLFAAVSLFRIFQEYKAGRDEYAQLEEFTDRGVKSTDEPTAAPVSGGQETKSDSDSATAEPVEATAEPTEATAEPARMTAEPNESGLDTMENPIDFASLKEINGDIIGWIEVEAVDAFYPIMQAEDNEYYLYRTFRKVNNINGSLFADYRNDPEFGDKNTVIYGHNMKDGSMFGSLKKYLERTIKVDGEETPGAYDVSPYFWIYTPDYIYKYEIYSVARVSGHSKDYERVFETEEDYQEFIDRTVGQSLIRTTATVSLEDSVVTLSTCTSDHEQRLIVQGKRIETYQAVPRADGYEPLEE